MLMVAFRSELSCQGFGRGWAVSVSEGCSWANRLLEGAALDYRSHVTLSPFVSLRSRTGVKGCREL